MLTYSWQRIKILPILSFGYLSQDFSNTALAYIVPAAARSPSQDRKPYNKSNVDCPVSLLSHHLFRQTGAINAGKV